MPLVHYVGAADEKVIRTGDFVAAGVNDQTTARFNESTEWKQNVSALASAWLLSMSDFSTVGISRAGDSDVTPQDKELSDLAEKVFALFEPSASTLLSDLTALYETWSVRIVDENDNYIVDENGVYVVVSVT